MRRAAAYVAVVTAACLAGSWYSGYSLAVNRSDSMPRGLYALKPLQPPAPGQLVAACIPPLHAGVYAVRGYVPPSPACPSGLAPVLKPVVATAGDTVAVSAAGVHVNGVLQPRSQLVSTDSQGLPIVHLAHGWHRQLAPGEVFLLATHSERSLDSRYYGPVTLADLRGIAAPVFTF